MTCFACDASGKEPACQETQEMQVKSLGQEGPLQEGTATRSSILARRIPWTEEPGGLQSIGSHRVRHNWSNLERTRNKHLYTHMLLVFGEQTFLGSSSQLNWLSICKTMYFPSFCLPCWLEAFVLIQDSGYLAGGESNNILGLFVFTKPAVVLLARSVFLNWSMAVKKDQPLQTANKVQVVKIRDDAVLRSPVCLGNRWPCLGSPLPSLSLLHLAPITELGSSWFSPCLFSCPVPGTQKVQKTESQGSVHPLPPPRS